MSRPYNFGAGPAMLPESILREAKAELLDWHHSGMSIMEVGHRTSLFIDLLDQAEEELRALLNIPKTYHVLFLGGAARSHFGMIPLNFLSKHLEAGYCITGQWSSLAYQEAVKLKQAYSVFGNEKEDGMINIPSLERWIIKEKTRYLYFTPNETVNGVRFLLNRIQSKVGSIPLIADMTSCLLSEPIDISQYGLIFAGAQKNIANAGLTIVILRDELLELINEDAIPTMLDYRTHCNNKSLYATPPTFNCYLAEKMFRWIRHQGGVEALYVLNCKKATKLYDYIDRSDFYGSKVPKDLRSIMNICFSLANPELEEIFLEKAAIRGLLALRGHRMVGGLRASLYNAMPMDGVDALIEFMTNFAMEFS